MKTILIAEDEKSFQKILSERLKNDGYLIELAENGQVALDILNRKHIDLILLDLIMPEMDGVTFLYRIKNTVYKNIPIIILTNLSSTSYPANFNLRGFFVKANTSLDSLSQKIKQSLVA